MLHWFRCDNCYSFVAKDSEQMNGISMDDPSDRDSYTPIEPLARGKARIWQFASIYGANASGKSNMLKAIGSMFDNIASTRRDLVGERFLFDRSLNEKPIFCEMCFSLLKPGSNTQYNEYRYGYQLKTHKNIIDDKYDDKELARYGKASEVLYEWLTIRDIHTDTDEDTEFIYYRDGKKLEFLNNYKDSPPAICLEKLFNKQKEEEIIPLVLRLAGEKEIEDQETDNIFSSIHAWCRKAILMERVSEKEDTWNLRSAAALVHKDQDGYKDRFLKYLKTFDECIVDVSVVCKGIDFELYIGHNMENVTSNNDKVVFRSIYKESYGTQKIAGMYPYFWDAMENGGLLMIDEIDIKLHPLVIRYLLEECQKSEKIQIIFSTHNLITLDKRYMHMDETWFVEKRANGKSSIFCLDTDSLGKDENEPEYINYRKPYLNGRFGAIPSQILDFQRGAENE